MQCLLSILTNSFFTGVETVFYFSLFSVIQSNQSNSFASPLMITLKSYFGPFWETAGIPLGTLNFKMQILFSCIVTIVSNFSIVCSVRRPLKESYSANIAFICFFVGFWLFRCQRQHIFFFSKTLIFFVTCSFKDLQNSFIQSFPQYKEYLFSNPQTVGNKYPRGVCSPIFVAEETCGLFSQLSIILTKHSIPTYIA